MEGPLEDIAFLTRSKNRVRVLSALAESAGSRRELGDRTHVSRVTLGRVLADFEARGWVSEEDGRYCITPLGKLVSDAFAQLHETVAAARDLRSASDWYPDDGFGFEFELLTEAAFTTPSQQDPLAPVRAAVANIETADEIRLLTNATAPESVSALRDGVVESDLDLEIVATTAVLETMAGDPGMAAEFGELFEADVPVFRTETDLPYIVAIHDETVDIALDDDRGVPAVLIEIAHPEVRSWAHERFEAHRRDADRLDRSRFEAMS